MEKEAFYQESLKKMEYEQKLVICRNWNKHIGCDKKKVMKRLFVYTVLKAGLCKNGYCIGFCNLSIMNTSTSIENLMVLME